MYNLYIYIIDNTFRGMEWQHTPVFLPGEFHGQSLAAYSPWDHKELDTTQQLLQRMNKTHETSSFIETPWTVKTEE